MRDSFPVGKLSIAYGTMLIFYQFSRLLLFAWTARVIGPEKYGLWNVMHPLLFYTMFLTLGIPNAVNRDIPYLLGLNNREKLTSMLNVSSSFLLIIFILILFCGEVATWLFVRSNSLSWSIFIVLTVSWQLYVCSQILLRSTMRFDTLAKQLFIFVLVFGSLTLVAIKPLSLNGMLLSMIAATLISIIYNFRKFAFKFRLNWDMRILKELIKRGFPIMISGFLFFLVTGLDKIIIGLFLSKNELGLYTVATLSAGLLLLVSGMIDQQFYPRISYRYGQTSQVISLKELMYLQGKISFFIVLILVILAQLFMEPAVRFLLPGYEEGVSAARWILLGLIPLSITGVFGSFLNAVARQNIYVLSQVIALIFLVATQLYFVLRWQSIEAVAVASSLGFTLYTLIVGSACLLTYNSLKLKSGLKLQELVSTDVFSN